MRLSDAAGGAVTTSKPKASSTGASAAARAGRLREHDAGPARGPGPRAQQRMQRASGVGGHELEELAFRGKARPCPGRRLLDHDSPRTVRQAQGALQRLPPRAGAGGNLDADIIGHGCENPRVGSDQNGACDHRIDEFPRRLCRIKGMVVILDIDDEIKSTPMDEFVEFMKSQRIEELDVAPAKWPS